MGREQVNKLAITLIMGAVLFVLVSPIMGIDHPVEPFQKAKALALMEGLPQEAKSGKMYILMIGGWGSIIYDPVREGIALMKGTPSDNSGVKYDGKYGRYSVSRRIEGAKPEIKFIDWSVAMDLAYKYLREIEAVRGGK